MSEEEIPLIFNEDNRIHYEGKLYFNIRRYNINNLINNHNNNIINDCIKAFNIKSSNSNYSTGSTYFQQSNKPPRCLLESLALQIFHLHTSECTYDESNSGAEWWTQVIDSNDDIGFHWDKDYGIEESTSFNLFPHLGTVTYLSDYGGPTVVLPCRGNGNLSKDVIISYDINKTFISCNKFGRHISFDGQLLHGAPANLNNDDDVSTNIINKRITFLVNIWLNHKPIDSKPLNKTILNKMTKDINTNVTITEIDNPLYSITNNRNEYKEFIREFKNDDISYQLTLKIPNNDLFDNLLIDKEIICIENEDNSNIGSISLSNKAKNNKLTKESVKRKVDNNNSSKNKKNKK